MKFLVIRRGSIARASVAATPDFDELSRVASRAAQPHLNSMTHQDSMLRIDATRLD
jgi:hypothetical protein